jgi:hypothetical protein
MLDWINDHSHSIAGVVAAIFTLFLMVNAETGSEAVMWLFTAPVFFTAVLAFLDGMTG